MHGDDAGSSAKVVWVVHPTKVPIDVNEGENRGADDSGANGTTVGTVGSPRANGLQGSSYLFTQKFGE